MTTRAIEIPVLKMALVIGLFTIGLCGPVAAQIAFTSDASLKSETKRSRREAAKVEADYKESHLDTHNYTYKKGKSGRKRVKAKDGREKYHFDRFGNAVYAEPVTFTSKRKARRNSTN